MQGRETVTVKIFVINMCKGEKHLHSKHLSLTHTRERNTVKTFVKHIQWRETVTVKTFALIHARGGNNCIQNICN